MLGFNSSRYFDRYWHLLLLMLTFISMLALSQIALCAEKPLTIGVFPRRNLTVTLTAFSSMADYLSKKLNRKVNISTTRNFKEFWKKVERKEFDVVHYNQYHYVKSHKELGYEVILKNEEQGESSIAGALVVRKDSNIFRVDDLRGKRIIFGGGIHAMQSYIVATQLLREKGLKENDYVEVFSNNPPNAVIATYFKKAAAGGTGGKVLYLKSVAKTINIDELWFLAKGKKLAHLPWAVKGDLSEKLKKKIQHLLSELKSFDEGKVILKKADLTALVKATDEEYDPHRKIIFEVLGEEF